MVWIPSVLTVFSLRTFTREVNVVQSFFNKYIIHCSFPSLCIWDDHGTFLEFTMRGSKLSYNEHCNCDLINQHVLPWRHPVIKGWWRSGAKCVFLPRAYNFVSSVSVYKCLPYIFSQSGGLDFKILSFVKKSYYLLK